MKSQNTIPLPLEYLPSNRLGDISFEGEVSLTKQSEAAACDINNIMGQYERTGLLPHVAQYQGQYAELGDALSYHDAMNTVVQAQEAFESLPASVRGRFGNDPAAFLDFVNDPANVDAMRDMGLLEGVVLPSSGDAEGAPDATVAAPDVPAKRGKSSPPPAATGGD